VYSLVAIAPVEVVDALDLVLQTQGWGAGSLSRRLSATGAEPATHFAGHGASVTQATRDLAEGRAMPAGLNPDQLAALPGLLAQCRVSFEPADGTMTGRQHFQRELDAAGLQVIEEPIP